VGNCSTKKRDSATVVMILVAPKLTANGFRGAFLVIVQWRFVDNVFGNHFRIPFGGTLSTIAKLNLFILVQEDSAAIFGEKVVVLHRHELKRYVDFKVIKELFYILFYKRAKL